MTAVRMLVALCGFWMCWHGLTVAQVKVLFTWELPKSKSNYIRALPIWSRVLMGIVGLACVLTAMFGK